MGFKRLIASLVAAAALCSAVPAAFADQSPRSWAGLYVGGHAAYGEVPLQESIVAPEGFVGGGQAGFNLQWGRLVAGIEGDYSAGSIDDTVALTDPIFGRASVGLEVDNIASVRGRLGFTAYDCLLLYGTLGYGWADVEASLSIPSVGIALSDSFDFEGAVYGAGVEYRFSDLVSGRIEGLRYDLHQEDNRDNGMNLDVVRVGLDFHLPVGR
jgi:outer membrane immunogenic protein